MKKQFRWVAGLAVLALVAGGNAVYSQKDTKKKGENSLDSKSEADKSAAKIDFQMELGLAYPSLLTLGSRIQQYRTSSPDPVGLAHAARELALAEKVSGKKASLTSEALMAEAVLLAKVRNDSSELTAVAAIVSDKKVQAELTAAAKKAESDAAERAKLAKEGVKSRGIHSQLTVRNHDHYHVDVYYNGRYLGIVRGHGYRSFYVHDHSPYFNLYARNHYGKRWRRHLHGGYRSLTWNLY